MDNGIKQGNEELGNAQDLGIQLGYPSRIRINRKIIRIKHRTGEHNGETSQWKDRDQSKTNTEKQHGVCSENQKSVTKLINH